MQEQNFENRVRHTLDGLLLDPSPPVWEEVEKELGKKKQRRRFLFFIVLLVPVCTGIALYFSGSFDRNEAGSAKGSPESIVNSSPTRTIQPTNEVPERSVPAMQPSAQTNSKAPAQNRDGANLSATAPFKRRGTTGRHANEPDQLFTKQHPSTPASPVARDMSEKTFTHSSPEQDEPLPGFDRHPVARKRVDSVHARKTEPVNQQSLSPFTPSFNHLSHGGPPTVNRKWQLNLHTAAGRSWVRASLFQDVQEVRANFQTGSAGGGVPPSRVPSRVNNGGVYTIGFNMRKPLSRTLWLATGLHYRLAQTRVKVGATVARDTTLRNNNSDFSVSGYYTPGAAQEITNHYHFLEVPLGLEWQPLRHVPLTLQTSMTAARMIASDAVVFGAQSRVYFREKKAYHNTQLYLGTAIDYRLIRTKGFSLRAGPYLHYGMTTLEKRGWVDQHLFAAGIKTNISF